MPIVEGRSAACWLAPLRPDGLAAFVAGLPQAEAAYLRGVGFQARAQEILLLPGESGVAGAVLGLGEDRSYLAFGDLAFRLPEGDWQLLPGDYATDCAVLGYCLGAYRFTEFRPSRRAPARLVVAEKPRAALSQAASIAMARDLVNLPANLLGPTELADAAESLAVLFGAAFSRVVGDDLAAPYPAVLAVGRGSSRPPVVASFTWRGSQAAGTAMHVSLCGKGVVFDSGGYDLKPSTSMLRMKKDMGGAASMLALARMLMEADLPIRLSVRLGCVENSISGHAMRPLDVIRTRAGLSVEIGNTDAEGRLVLCDLLAAASEEHPDLLIDCATLTGAARVALGPDLPALFCNDARWAGEFLAAGAAECDPMWQLPLWDGYDSWLDSNVADLGSVSGKTQAGAVTAALFLRRFVAPGIAWAHLDTYAWNDSSRPARPEGGEVMGMRAMATAITRFCGGATTISRQE
jgi:leucyl aminopeptidase